MRHLFFMFTFMAWISAVTVLPCFADNFKEATIIFNPRVQFQYSDRGVQETFHRVGNGPFSPFKTTGTFDGRVFKGMGLNMNNGKLDYGCTVELTLDKTFSMIEKFKFEVNTQEIINKKRRDTKRTNYYIEGVKLPLHHRTSGKDKDMLFYSLKGPLAKKNISKLDVKVTTNVQKQVSKDNWVPKTYWRKSVDFKLSANDGFFVLLKGKVNQNLSFNDNSENIYDIEKEVYGRVSEPTLDFTLGMVDRKKIASGLQAIKLSFAGSAKIDSPFYGKDTQQANVNIYPFLKPKWHEWHSDMSLGIKIPLYEVLHQIYREKGVYEYLTEKQFRPLDPKAIPEQTTLDLTLNLKSAHYQDKTNKKDQKIQINNNLSFKKTFILGPELDLAKETKLKVGKAHSMDWHDLSGVILATAKTLTQVDKLQAAITITDCIIQTHGGYVSATNGNYIGTAESAGSVAGSAIGFKDRFKDISNNLGIVFLIPQLKRLVHDEIWGTPALVRKVESGMELLGYYPLNQARATKGFPIWFNPKLQKLALIDPVGLVHPVKPPKNFHISWGFFQLHQTEPAGKSLLFKKETDTGWSGWWRLGGPLVKNHKILPPVKPFRRLRMKLPTPSGYTGKQRQIGFGTVRSVKFTHSKNSKIVLERADEYDGIVDFGWADDPVPLVFEKPFLTLLSGRLRVKDEASSIGIGFSVYKKGKYRPYKPQLWCEPKGTAYTIDYNPKTGICQIEVVDGQVLVRSGKNNDVIDQVLAGSKKQFNVPMNEASLKELFDSENIKGEMPDKPISADRKTGKKQNRSYSELLPVTKDNKPTLEKNYLGILFPKTTQKLIVVNTYPDSPATKAGIKSGDILQKVNGKNISYLKPKEFNQMIQSLSARNAMKIFIKSGNTVKTVSVMLERQPEKTLQKRHQAAKKKAAHFYKKAEEYKQKKSYRMAAEEYAKAIRFDPEQSLAYDYQAYSLDRINKRHMAYPILKMSLLLEDRMYNNYLYGKFLNYDREYKRAIPYLEKATQKTKQTGGFYFSFRELGGARFVLDDYRGAISALLISEKMGDQSPLSIGTLGVCFDKTNQKKKAVRYYRRYLSMNSSNKQMNRMARNRLAKLEK